MNNRVATEKAAIRARVLARRSAITPFRWWRSGAIARRLSGLSALRRARVVLAYFPIRGEVDTRPVIRWCLRTGRTVALPVCLPNSRHLRFVSLAGMHEVGQGRFGIPEPLSGEIVDPAAADVILVPGVAFSVRGERIGYGAGYYDATLSRCRGVSIGIGFESQVFPSLPQRRGDTLLNALVTESRTIVFGAPQHGCQPG